MEEKEFEEKLKNGEIEEVESEEPKTKPKEETITQPTLEDYIPFLEKLRQLKSYGDSVPTHTPKSFTEQIYFYISGATKRVYFWFNNTWSKVFDSVQWTDLTDGGTTTLHKHELIAFPHTQVFDGTSPAAYTDLDLSSVVGANSALVYLRVKSGSVPTQVEFRRNGETEEVDAAPAAGHGTDALELTDSAAINHILVETDEDGIVEWKVSNTGSFDIYLDAYISQ